MEDKFLLEIPQGKLQGREYTSDFNGATYYCFLGIPYAQPPVENLRFMVSNFFLQVSQLPSK